MAVIPYKVLAEEINGVDQPFPTEILMSATNTVFAPTTTNTADNVQDAITNSSKSFNRLYAEATTTLVTTSTTLATDTALTLTPGAGRFAIWYSAQTETGGLSARGEIELFKNTSGILSSIRQVDSNIAGGGIGGLTGLSLATPVSIVSEQTFVAGDQLLVKYRCADLGLLGSYTITQRSILLLQTGI